MELPSWNKEQKQACLGCLRWMAKLEGEASEHQRAFLEALRGVFGLEPGEGDTRGPDWPRLRDIFGEASDRVLVLQGSILMAMADGAVSMEEVHALELAQVELGVSEPRVPFMRLYAEGRHRRLQLAVPFSSQMIKDKFREAWERGGLLAVLIFMTFPYGLFTDSALETKYRALAEYPVGSFGHAYSEHLQANGFSFPGAKGGFPEVLAAHDYAHVLGGYGTSPLGECEVIAFVAGFITQDPFWYIFAIVTHMHLDLEVFIGDPTAHLAGDPERMIDAFMRGMKVKRDLYDAWDPWEDFPLPLLEVQEKYGVSVA